MVCARGATSAGNPTFTGCKTVLHYQARMQYLYAIMAPQTGRSTTVAGGSLMVKPVPDLEAVVEAAARPTSRRPTRADCPDVAAGRHRADHDSRGSGDPDAAEDAGGRTADDCTSPRLRGPQCRVRAAPQAGDCEVKTGPGGYSRIDVQVYTCTYGGPHPSRLRLRGDGRGVAGDHRGSGRRGDLRLERAGTSRRGRAWRPGPAGGRLTSGRPDLRRCG